MTVVLGMTVLVVLGMTALAHANSEYVIRTESGQDPYLIVVEDKTGASSKAPGIYGREVSGAWRMLMPGSVVGGQTTGGVLAHLEASHIDGRYQTVVIVDGEVRIFHLHTHPNDPKSFIVLGGDGAPAHDLFFPTRRVHLPRLSSSNDVSLAQAPIDAERKEQALLISMRLPHPTLQGGDGVTLLVLVKAAQNSKSSVLELVRDPVVIDYKFQSEAELNRLWIHDPKRRQTTGVLSRMLLEHHSRSPEKNEPAAIREWRESLTIFSREFLDRGEQFDYTTPPYVDFATGTIQTGDLPQFSQVLTRQMMIAQIYDPVAGREGVYIGPAKEITPREFTFWGRIDIGENGEHQIFIAQNENSGSSEALVYINGQLYFVSGTEETMVRIYGQNIPKPEKLNFFVKTQLIDGQRTHVLFISGLWKKGGSATAETFVFFIRQEEDSGIKILKVEKTFGLIQKQYEEFELKARLHELNGELFFDILTPPQESEAAYAQVYDDTVRHLNIGRSRAGALRGGYLKAKEEISVIPNRLTFRAFNEPVGRETGLFLHKDESTDTGTPESFPGDLLIPLGARPGLSKEKPFLFSEVIDLPAIQDKGHLYAIAYDPSFRQGAEGFSILLVLVPDSTSKAKFHPLAHAIPCRFPISRLKSVLLFAGKKKNADQSTLLVSVDSSSSSPEHSSLKGGGVFPLSFQIQRGIRKEDVDQLAVRMTFSGNFLVPHVLLPSEMAARLMLDGTGRLYWILDPKKSKTAADYRLLRLGDGNIVLENSTDGRALGLVSLLDAKEGDPKAVARFSSATWRIFGRYAAEDLAKLFNAYDEQADDSSSKESASPALEAVVKGHKEKQRKVTIHQRMRDFFPGLTTLLHEAADPSRPAQHQVILVPEDQHSLLIGYIFRLWMEERGAQQQKFLPENFRWSAENDDLKIYSPRQQVGGQDDVFENFSEMASLRSTDRAVVIVNMQELIPMNRPQNRTDTDQEPFLIASALPQGAEHKSIPPHILYWLATEGRKVDLEHFAKLSPENVERKVSILLIGSRTTWKKLTQQAGEGAEIKAGLLRHFSDQISYFHGAWRVWGPNTTLVGPLIQGLVEKGVERYREEVFPELEAVLQEVSKGERPARHRVLIVPPEIKEYVRNSIFARWADASLAKNPWNHQNLKLRLFHLAQPSKGATGSPSSPSQEEIIENLEIMKGLSGDQNPVLIADLNMIGTLNRPAGSVFQIEDLALHEEGEASATAPDVEVEAINPHALYLLATEGAQVPLKDFESFSKDPKKIPMLFIGTEAEWTRALEDAAIEKRGGIGQHFERVTLSVPDHLTRKKMLAQILARPEIRSLRYVFDPRVSESKEPEPADPAKAQDEVLAYVVSTCERIARENNMDVLTAFLKVFQAFNRALVKDETTRNRKRIDRIEVQRILAQVFRMQLNPTLLPPNDPLVVLKREDFPLLMQQAGAEGPFEQAIRVAKILLKQTEPTPKIPIPASVIMFGESSSGKTKFAYSLLKVLGLKLYDFNKPRDPEAQAFVLNCRKLIDEGEDGAVAWNEEEPAGDGVMTVRQALKHLDNFLTLPRGSRGFIIIDDAHAPKDSIRAKIIAKIQSLVGSEDGMWRGRSEFQDNENIQEVPLQNMTLFVIANPTYDQKRIKQFKKDEWANPTLEELLLSSLTTDEQKLDPSFLKRFSGIIRMDTFASEARGPAVLGDTRKGAHQIFSSQNRLILVSPQAAEAICLRFPVDARTLLSQVPQALLSKVENASSTPVHIVVPSTVAGEIVPQSTGQYDERAIEAYVQAHIQAFPISKECFEGRLELLKYLLGSLRVHLIETLIKSAQRDVRFAADVVVQQTILAPLFHAIKAHLELNPGIRLEDLVLNSMDFGTINTASEADFRRSLTARDTVKRGFWPKWIFSPTRNRDLADLALGGKRFVVRDRSRRDVLVETSRGLEAQLKEFAAAYFQLGSLESLPSAHTWLEGMKPVDTEVSERMGKHLGDVFLDFLFNFQKADLVEVIDAGSYSPITPYDAARFFLLTLDRAISRLPWGVLTQFMTSSLAVATQEISLGERPNVQALFFENRDSFLAARTPELPVQMVINTSVFKDWRGESTDTTKEERMGKRLLDECERMLSKPDAS